LDRCALFVDASYVLTDGALAVHGTRNRDSVSWDYAGVLKLLSGLSKDQTGVPVLRCYWYDSAASGDRAAEHDTVADLPGIKLRLSKARPSRREGVEAEIRRDLTALARNRAVSDVVIVSGEEDLGSVIAEVQDLGIRATLLHVAIDGGEKVSRALRQECDDAVEISAVHLRPFVDLIHGAEPAAGDGGMAGRDYRQQAAGGFAEPALVDYRDPVAGHHEPAAVGYRETASGMHASGYPDRAVGADQPQQGAVRPAAALYAPDLHGAGQPPALGSAASAPGRDDFGQYGVARDSAVGVPNGHPGSPGQRGFSQSAVSVPPGQDNGRVAQNSLQGAGAVPGEVLQADSLPVSGAGHGMPTNGTTAGMPGAATSPGGVGQDRAALNGMPAGPSGRKAGAQPSVGDPLSATHAPQAHHAQAPQGQHHLPQQPGVGMPPASREAGNPGMHQAVGPGPGMPTADFGTGGPQQGGLAQGGLPERGLPERGLPERGLPERGLPQRGPQQDGIQPNAMQPSEFQQGGLQQGGLQQGGLQNSGLAPNGLPPNGPPRGGTPYEGRRQNALPSGALPQNGMPPGAFPQNGLPPGAFPQNGLPPGAFPQNGLPPGALPQNGLPPGAFPQNGLPPGAFPQNGLPPGAFPQNGLPPGALPQNGLPQGGPPAMDGPRSNPPQRQLPAGNGIHYPADRADPYGGQPAAGQRYDPAHGGIDYHAAPYGGPPVPALPPPAISVADAVQSAHAEGYGFGEAVARDAPALWLEAVLARKPRMPSDLEARLLQGSALPIDSLLHDEVRHALRRGFWDALERSRH
jgi:uncharacterized LabA/DUF88 family protein